MVCITLGSHCEEPHRRTTKQSQSEIATPFGLAMTFFAIPNANYFMLSVVF